MDVLTKSLIIICGRKARNCKTVPLAKSAKKSFFRIELRVISRFSTGKS